MTPVMMCPQEHPFAASRSEHPTPVPELARSLRAQSNYVRLKIKDVFIPPKAKLFDMRYSIWMRRGLHMR